MPPLLRNFLLSCTGFTAAFRWSSSSGRRCIMPLFKSCLKLKHRVCLRDKRGEYTFLGLAKSSRKLSLEISRLLARQLQERVAVLCPNNGFNVLAQWAAWMSGQIVVPLDPDFPFDNLEYILKDAGVVLAITTAEHVSKLKTLINKNNIELLVLDTDLLDKAKANLQLKEEIITENDISEEEYGQSAEFYAEKDALIVYTAGTSGSAKGVVLSFRNIDSQISSVVTPWSLTAKDCVLNCRSLSITDSITCGLMAPMSVGGSVILLETFTVEEVWGEMLGVKGIKSERMNVLYGESWMYRKLVEEYESVLKKNEKLEEYIKGICLQKIRLMISTSSPLPRSIQEKWESYTGHEVLEAYSLSETGIVTTPRTSTSKHSGTVGLPVPGIKLKIMSDDGSVMAEGDSTGTKVLSIWQNRPVAGTLWAKGDNVSRKYWKKPLESWTADGWFKTGDIMSYNRGLYNILGRQQCDIVKSKSFKVSLQQIEAAILDMSEVQDVATFCLMHDGLSIIAAAVNMKAGQKLDAEKIRTFLLLRFPDYAIPSIFLDVPQIPRNHRGKLVRSEIMELFIPKIKSELDARKPSKQREGPKRN